MLCHMVASRCESQFSVLANVYRWFNKEIEQLANQQANIVTFCEWVDGTMDSRVEDSKLFCAQIVPRRVLIVPHEYSRKKSQWAKIANCEFLFFINTSQAKSVYLRSSGGKNATTIALQWIIEVRLPRTGSHVREAPHHALGGFSLNGLSALCGHCIKHSQTGALHRYTFER